MALTDRLGKSKTIAEIKSSLLNPALTSHFDVEMPFPRELRSILGVNQRSFNLSCSDASLPGSQLTTFDINNDRTGVTETHAYRRQFDGKLDLTFYVDAERYASIRFFEAWISFIMNEDDGGLQGGSEIDPGIAARNYNYRTKYPNTYIADQGLKITKFERNYQNQLTYNFVRAYPVAISSMTVSYDASSLLKLTVTMSYIRYFINRASARSPGSTPPNATQQAEINNQFFNSDLGLDFGTQNFTPNGIDLNAIGAGGGDFSQGFTNDERRRIFTSDLF